MKIDIETYCIQSLVLSQRNTTELNGEFRELCWKSEDPG